MVASGACRAYYLGTKLWVLIVRLLEISLLVYGNLWVLVIESLGSVCVESLVFFWSLFKLFVAPDFDALVAGFFLLLR
jgi:hypothetical protein